MGLTEDYITRDATALADLVRHRQFSPAELVEVAITRLEQVEPKLAGMAEWTLDQARRVACEPLADTPFAGVPFLLKDNMHFAAGIPYHNGSRIWRGWVPPRDSELVRRFKTAGLIILGSTKVPELSLTPVTEPRHFGRANNLGRWIALRAAHREDRRPTLQPARCRWPMPPMEAARSGFQRPAVASSGSSPPVGALRMVPISAKAGMAPPSAML
jgi:hypothetical protein